MMTIGVHDDQQPVGQSAQDLTLTTTDQLTPKPGDINPGYSKIKFSFFLLFSHLLTKQGRTRILLCFFLVFVQREPIMDESYGRPFESMANLLSFLLFCSFINAQRRSGGEGLNRMSVLERLRDASKGG